MGIFFGKAFRILGVKSEREGRLRGVVKKYFHGNVWVNHCYNDGFLPFSPVSLTESCSFWYCLKDLFTPHKLS